MNDAYTINELHKATKIPKPTIVRMLQQSDCHAEPGKSEGRGKPRNLYRLADLPENYRLTLMMHRREQLLKEEEEKTPGRTRGSAPAAAQASNPAPTPVKAPDADAEERGLPVTLGAGGGAPVKPVDLTGAGSTARRSRRPWRGGGWCSSIASLCRTLRAGRP